MQRKTKPKENFCVEPLLFLSTGGTASESDSKVKTRKTKTSTGNENNRRKKNKKRNSSDENKVECDPESGSSEEQGVCSEVHPETTVSSQIKQDKLDRKKQNTGGKEPLLHEILNPETAVSGRVEPGPKKHKHIQDNKPLIYPKYHPLSNLYHAPFTVNGQNYTSVAQFTLHRKALLFGDLEAAETILNSTGIEQISFKVKGFSQERWEQEHQKILYEGVFHKFSQNADLQERLLETDERYVVYRSRHLRYGIGLITDCEDNLNNRRLRGRNMSG